MKRLLLISFFAGLLPLQSAPLFNMAKMLDASTLEVEVLKDWHMVGGGFCYPSEINYHSGW